MNQGLHVELNGNPTKPVVLLHGLACNGAVWDPLVAALTARGCGTIVPDLCGHGRSSWQPAYSLAEHAAAVAALIPEGRTVSIIGHSMGASVGLVLANGHYGINVTDILAVGLKVCWSNDEIERMGMVRPLRYFKERTDVADLFLRVTGLKGLVADNHRCVGAGIAKSAEGFHLATDPRTVSVVQESVVPLLDEARRHHVRLRLACGSDDKLVIAETLREWDERAVCISGGGHNVHLDVGQILEVFDQMRKEIIA